MRSRVKTHRLFIRLSEVDRQRIEQLAAANDLDISKYVRQAALNGNILPSRQSFQQLLRQVEIRCYRALRFCQSGEVNASAMAAALKGCLAIVQGFEDDCKHDRNE
jgi:ribosomal protein S13